MLSFWHDQLVVRHQQSLLVGSHQTSCGKNPDLISCWWGLGCPTGEFEASLQQAWPFHLQQSSFLGLFEDQHRPPALQA